MFVCLTFSFESGVVYNADYLMCEREYSSDNIYMHDYCKLVFNGDD